MFVSRFKAFSYPSMLFRPACKFFARNLDNSNFNKYLKLKSEKEAKEVKPQASKPSKKETSAPQSVKHAQFIEAQSNKLKLTPYFENAVEKVETDHATLTYKEKTFKIKGGGRPKTDLKKSEMRFLNKVKIIKEQVKRQMHDSSIYRNELSSMDLDGHEKIVKRAMSLDNASIEEFRKARMLEIRKL